MLIQFADQRCIPSRNRLLQTTLRSDPRGYAIEEEYPIVLAHSNHHYSLCVFSDATQRDVIAHASLFPRDISTTAGQVLRTLLIGNVATQPQFQKQGIMRQLFNTIEAYANDNAFQCLMLWSHLDLFYNKLGFSPFGKEIRYSFANQHSRSTRYDFARLDPDLARDEDLENLIALRPALDGSISRSLAEFRAYLSIPDTYLITSASVPHSCYGIVGKGADMIGVVHEWGCVDPAELIALLDFILAHTKWPEMILLTPRNLPSTFRTQFSQRAQGTSVHPVGLARILDPSIADALEGLFIWGFDSI